MSRCTCRDCHHLIFVGGACFLTYVCQRRTRSIGQPSIFTSRPHSGRIMSFWGSRFGSSHLQYVCWKAIAGGPERFGFPDDGYCQRVLEEEMALLSFHSCSYPFCRIQPKQNEMLAVGSGKRTVRKSRMIIDLGL